MTHAPVLPILLPLLTAAVLAIAGDARVRAGRTLSLASGAAQFALGVTLLMLAADDTRLVYEVGRWPAPFGIVLVLDRLSALMVLLGGIVSLAGLIHAIAGTDVRGRHFHAFWHLQMAGLNGAFLTGDLFNLFVFFEVLLAASYCLLLHGHGPDRARAAVHYVVINLVASALFLVAVSLLYGVTGTLNLAHLSERLAQIDPADMPLAATAALMLIAVFAVKAALFPLGFWLTDSYPAASAPVACLFAIMTKVGAYAIFRVHVAALGGVEALAELAAPWLAGAALATLAFGAAGALQATTLRALASYLTILSMGTLFIAAAWSTPATIAAATYYLASSTLTTAALFLLADVIGARRGASGDRLLPGPATSRVLPIGIGLAIASGAAVGLPPTSGFIGKVLVLRSVAGGPIDAWLWTAVLVASFLALVAVSRAFSVLLWNTRDDVPPAGVAPASPALPVAGLVALLAALAIAAGPAARYGEATAAQLFDRTGYSRAVLGSAGAPTIDRTPSR